MPIFSTRGGPFACDKNTERRQAWLQIKAKGKKRYVWRTGVMGWGLPVFAIFTPVMLVFGPSTHQLSKAKVAGATVLSLLIWIIGGYPFGPLDVENIRQEISLTPLGEKSPLHYNFNSTLASWPKSTTPG